jgi:hypothetical protein
MPVGSPQEAEGAKAALIRAKDGECKTAKQTERVVAIAAQPVAVVESLTTILHLGYHEGFSRAIRIRID